MNGRTSTVSASFASLFGDAATAQSCETGTETTTTATALLLGHRCLLLITHLYCRVRNWTSMSVKDVHILAVVVVVDNNLVVVEGRNLLAAGILVVRRR